MLLRRFFQPASVALQVVSSPELAAVNIADGESSDNDTDDAVVEWSVSPSSSNREESSDDELEPSPSNPDAPLTSLRSRSSNSSKQSVTFSTKWLLGRRNWLRFDKEAGEMFCTLCQKYGKMTCREGTWNISPCTRLRLESITRHEKSSSHIDSVRSERNRSLPEAINPPSRSSDIEKVFSCLYFSASEKLPIRRITNICWTSSNTWV